MRLVPSDLHSPRSYFVLLFTPGFTMLDGKKNSQKKQMTAGEQNPRGRWGRPGRACAPGDAPSGPCPRSPAPRRQHRAPPGVSAGGRRPLASRVLLPLAFSFWRRRWMGSPQKVAPGSGGRRWCFVEPRGPPPSSAEPACKQVEAESKCQGF